ncbi:hypothetical protein TNCV_437911 [Trichonephila clavipes]|nr:hypothetical protein TNCV_437911 [Trichonephila clavipes]
MAQRKGKPRGKQTMLLLIVHSTCGFHKEGAIETRYLLCENALELNEKLGSLADFKGQNEARISKTKRRKRVTRDMSTLKNSMLELAVKFDDNYNTGLIKIVYVWLE